MGKPFLSIEQQVELLERRGVKVDEETSSILLREGYYSVVNGYKMPFIDHQASVEAGDDRFASGTAFSDIYDLFSFDRKLRGIDLSLSCESRGSCENRDFILFFRFVS